MFCRLDASGPEAEVSSALTREVRQRHSRLRLTLKREAVLGDHRSCTRREFLDRTTSCAAHMGIMAAASPLWARGLWTRQERFPVVASEPWGRLEEITEGIWALVSNPLEDRTTLCNGGIVAGRAGVVVIESFASDEGARWMAGQAMPCRRSSQP